MNVRKAIRRYRRLKTIRSIRGHLAYFGHSTSGMTDAQCYRMFLRGQRNSRLAFRLAGFSIDECASGFRSLAKAMAAPDRITS